MLERRAGTLLFTGGGLALAPSSAAAALSVGKAALRAWVLALHDALSEHGVHATTVTIAGTVRPGTHFDPDRIADTYWQQHNQLRADWQAEVVYR
jgi:short-subunit dehydrogenase